MHNFGVNPLSHDQKKMLEGRCLGGCGVVRAQVAKARGPGFDLQQLLGFILFQQAFQCALQMGCMMPSVV